MSFQVVPGGEQVSVQHVLRISDAMQAIEGMMMGDTLVFKLQPVMLTRIDLGNRPIVYGKW